MLVYFRRGSPWFDLLPPLGILVASPLLLRILALGVYSSPEIPPICLCWAVAYNLKQSYCYSEGVNNTGTLIEYNIIYYVMLTPLLVIQPGGSGLREYSWSIIQFSIILELIWTLHNYVLCVLVCVCVCVCSVYPLMNESLGVLMQRSPLKTDGILPQSLQRVNTPDKLFYGAPLGDKNHYFFIGPPPIISL